MKLDRLEQLFGSGLSEADLKVWNEIQRLKIRSNERPGLDVKERLLELRRELYRRTGGNGG